MTDLIERLRNHLEYGYEGAMGDSLPSAICQEAADEIERLQKELVTENMAWKKLLDEQQAEIEQLTEQLDWHQQESVLRDMAIDAQKAEIERLNCALTISRGKHENAIREIERLTAVVDAAIALRDRIEPRSKGGIADEYYALDAALAALEDE